MKNKKIIIIISIVFIVLIILLKNNIIILSKGNIDGIKYSNYQKIEIKKPLMASSKPWEELTILEQYHEVKTFNNTVYKNCNSKPIPITIVNEKIGEWLDYDKRKIADIYSIKDISKDVAIALNFSNTIEYYTYINQVCPETTLEEFVNKYNIIDNNFIFESIDYTKIKNHKKIILENKNFENSEIKKILFNNLNLTLTNFYDKIESPYITFQTNSDIYGNGIIFYLTKNNKLLVEIPSIKKLLLCELEKNYFNEIINNIKTNSDAQLKIYIEK